MSDDFTNEITKALADLEGQAPPPPSLDDIRVGGPVPLAARPRPAWRRPVVLVGAAAAVTVVVVGLAALVASGIGGSGDPVADTPTTTAPVVTQTSDAVPTGVWIVTGFTSGGEAITIDPALVAETNTRPAYVEITGEIVEGWSGCNTFTTAGPPTISEGSITLGQATWTAQNCLDEEFFSVPILEDAFTQGVVPFAVEGSEMIWILDAGEVRFERSDQVPSSPLPVWGTGIGRLDCSPDSVMWLTVPGRDVDPAIIFELIPGVVSVEGDAVLGSADPFAWGLDASGMVIAGTAPGDIEPPRYEVFFCATAFRISSGADLTAAVGSWVNGLGLDQTDITTWNLRLADICNPEEDLGVLAGFYVDKDAPLTLAADDSVPTVGQATQTLAAIRSSICALPEDTPTTTVPAPAATVPGETACSSLGADGPAIDASFQGLPEPVLEARALLLRLAIACDLEGIVGYAANSAGGAALADEIFFWGNADSVDLLRAYDAETGALLLLVEALTRVPYEEILMSEYDPEEVVPDAVFYSWPPQADLTGGRSLADVWDEPTLIAVATLNGVSVDELVELSDEIGGYAGFRVGIRDDGRWLFALAGD